MLCRNMTWPKHTTTTESPSFLPLRVCLGWTTWNWSIQRKWLSSPTTRRSFRVSFLCLLQEHLTKKLTLRWPFLVDLFDASCLMKNFQLWTWSPAPRLLMGLHKWGPRRGGLFENPHRICSLLPVSCLSRRLEALVVPTHPLGGCHIFTNERRKQGDKSPHVTHFVWILHVIQCSFGLCCLVSLYDFCGCIMITKFAGH